MTYYELGDHNVPKNWAQYVVKRDKGETPGPPIIWSAPQIPDGAEQVPGDPPQEMPHDHISHEWEMPWQQFEEQVVEELIPMDSSGFICIMPPMLPDDEIIIEQPMPDDQLMENEFPCDVTATDYCGNFIYENGKLKRILIPGGFVTFANDNINLPEYHFYLTDHQGNIRVVAKADGEVEQVNHYYPYGGLMGESINSDTQPYKYNGKEFDRHSGLDWYDYGARWYNGISWMTPDPLAEKYYDVSPYVYCLGNPIKYVDPDGRRVYQGKLLAIYLQDGKLTLSPKVNDYTKAFYNGMMKTETGKKQLMLMVNSPTSIYLEYSHRNTNTNTSVTYAITQQAKQDGSSIRIKNGKYSSTWAKITFFVDMIKESMSQKGNDNFNLSFDEAMGAEGVHESVHAADPAEVHRDIKASQPKQKRISKYVYEKKAREVESKYREELKEQKRLEELNHER